MFSVRGTRTHKHQVLVFLPEPFNDELLLNHKNFQEVYRSLKRFLFFPPIKVNNKNEKQQNVYNVQLQWVDRLPFIFYVLIAQLYACNYSMLIT